MGIDRTFTKISEADIVLWLIDLTAYREQYTALAPSILPAAQGKQLVILLNKQDLVDAPTLAQAQAYLKEQLTSAASSESLQPFTLLSLSAQHNKGIQQLRTLLSNTLAQLRQTHNSTGTIVSNLRHYEALSSALIAIDRVIEGLNQGLSGDFVSQDLRECIYHLNDIAGEVTTDEVLGNIFKHFCVGK